MISDEDHSYFLLLLIAEAIVSSRRVLYQRNQRIKSMDVFTGMPSVEAAACIAEQMMNVLGWCCLVPFHREKENRNIRAQVFPNRGICIICCILLA